MTNYWSKLTAREQQSKRARYNHIIDIIKKGGGGGGTTDYNDLYNKPEIENHELKNNTLLEDIGLKKAESIEADSKEIVPFGIMVEYVDKVITI